MSRIVNAGIQLAAIPLILRFLGTQDYSVFAVVTGLLMWFNLADIGLGFSIQNHISLLRVKGGSDTLFLQKIAIFILVIGCLELVIFSVIAPFLQHFLLHKLEVTTPFYLLMLAGDLYMLSALFGVGYRVFFARQQGYFAYLYQTVSYVLGFFLVALCVLLHVNAKLPWVVVAWVLPQALCALIGFLHAMPLGNWLRAADFSMFKTIFKKAWQYGFNALGAAFVLGVDYIIMAQLLNANDITVYNIFNKIFSFMYFGYTAILAAIWPVLAEYYATFSRKAFQKANAMLIRNALAATLYVVGGTCTILLLKGFLLSLFIKTQLMVSGTILILFGFYYITRVWTDTYATAVQSQNKIGFIAATVPIQAVVSVVFLYGFGKWLGLPGIVLGLGLCFLVTGCWMLPVYHYYSLGKLRGS